MNSKQFNQAAEIVKKLRQKPAQEELLQLYGLFKQAWNV
jgi:acyl-CoA-binding protein